MPLTTNDSTDQQEHWAVLGGGILGMTTALRLAQQGHRVTLLESRQRLGGLADAWQIGDVTWDRHYHVTLMSDLHTRSLLEELNLYDQMEWVETKTGFYTDGKLHSMSNSLEFLKFPPLRLIDKLRLGATIFYASRVRNWKKLEQIPVGKWLQKLSGERTFQKIWLPLLRSKLGDCWRQTSAAFIWATIARMYAARRTGLKKEMFGYVRGGYASVNNELAQKLIDLGVEIRCNNAVRMISPYQDARVRVHLADESLVFDRVVSTLPSPVMGRICPELTNREKERFEGVQYHGIICASVLLNKPLSPYYVTNITDEGLPFTAVIEMTSLVKKKHMNGYTLVYLPRYVRPDDEGFRKIDAELEDEFISGLQKMHPTLSMADVAAFKVSRVPHVFALPTLGYSERLPPTQTSIPNLMAVSSANIVNGTLNVNETIKLANEFAAEFGASPRVTVEHESLDPKATNQPFQIGVAD
ncbi:MAG: NAD(P)/FAD-dependent oxidoreductase [Planctomycetaceae bacterium]|nr:NAD(P)/FAD-dependent oxidoreductase [Planctomycetaceae bacterium]